MDSSTDDLFTELGYRLVASVDHDQAERNLRRLAVWTSDQQADLLIERLGSGR